MSSKVMEEGGVSGTSSPRPLSPDGGGKEKPIGSEPTISNECQGTAGQTTGGGGALGFVKKILRAGRVEETGIEPVPLEERTNTKFYNVFTVWCSMNCNILP